MATSSGFFFFTVELRGGYSDVLGQGDVPGLISSPGGED